MDLRFRVGDANVCDLPYFVNNIFHSIFADCTVSANGIKNSTGIGHYAHEYEKKTGTIPAAYIFQQHIKA